MTRLIHLVTLIAVVAMGICTRTYAQAPVPAPGGGVVPVKCTVTVHILSVEMEHYLTLFGLFPSGTKHVRVTFTADASGGPGPVGAIVRDTYSVPAHFKVTAPNGAITLVSGSADFISVFADVQPLAGSGPRHLLGQADDRTNVDMAAFAPQWRALEGSSFVDDQGNAFTVLSVEGKVEFLTSIDGHSPDCEGGHDFKLFNEIMRIPEHVIR